MHLRIRRRSATGLPQDWSSISDVGRTFGDKKLSEDEYLRVELQFETFVARCLSGALPLEVAETENPRGTDAEWLKRGRVFNEAELRALTVDCLRERYWCKLKGTNGTYLHFGYDMIVYVGTSGAPAPPSLLCVDEMESPYD